MYQLRIILLFVCCYGLAPVIAQTNYLNNRAPLVSKPYVELPLGSIKPKGWLLEMLKAQKTGATGQMDVLYPGMMGQSNGWLGGNGDQWEQGPYWIDGLLPLAYILNDAELKAKALPWVEWILKSQQANGFMGPDKDDNSARDWWPRMVALKILQQYYSATGDERVITFMTNYFKYQLATLPTQKIDHYSVWAKFRACDNLHIVLWLYNITGEQSLLSLADLLHEQGHDYTEMFLDRNELTRTYSIHCVNLAQGIKEPVVYYQRSKDKKHLAATKKAFSDIKTFHGQAQGMYGGDEQLHGNNPTQGSEFCSAVEMMYSLERMIEITGDMEYIERLEKIAFNALPTQATDDFMWHQYFQQANQVMISLHKRNFEQDHRGSDLVFGHRSGYPCCFANMHQGWPKFVQSLFYATPDQGVAALVYSPAEVKMKVGEEVDIKITEETYYPMEEKIRFTLTIESANVSQVAFPFHLRIPSWSSESTIAINGGEAKKVSSNQIEIVSRTWKSGDYVDICFTPEIKVDDSWYQQSVSVERGPLVYALKIGEEWTKKEYFGQEVDWYGKNYYEVLPTSKWNYGLEPFEGKNLQDVFTVKIDNEKLKKTYPWNLENAPIELVVKAQQVPEWGLLNEMTAPLPHRPKGNGTTEQIILIPYGCSTLRVAQFPVIAP